MKTYVKIRKINHVMWENRPGPKIIIHKLRIKIHKSIFTQNTHTYTLIDTHTYTDTTTHTHTHTLPCLEKGNTLECC